jgi:hypothetical protein
MSTNFHKGNELNSCLEHLFEDAEEQLILISPYIPLHERYASVLKAKLDNDKLAISLVFGKNEEDPSRSMRRIDLDFFMQFPNIEIRYEPRLHAKYYANEHIALITSMNLYRYSQDHNIEAGVSMTKKASIDGDAFNYFDRVIEQAELIYEKRPNYVKGLMGLSKKYDGSEVVEDRVAQFFSGGKEPAQSKRPFRTVETPTRVKANGTKQNGFCIRTGVTIPFNTKRPLCDEAFKSWNRYKDRDYGEKFCHLTGEPSNGETSYGKPILKKNWNKAKEKFEL